LNKKEGYLHKKIVIIGCGGHSRSVADIVLANNPEALLLFVDHNARENETIYGFPVVKESPTEYLPIFLAIGDNKSRMSKFEELAGAQFISIVSRNSHIGHGAIVGAGCFVGNYCHIGPEAQIGKNTIINNAAIVEHEVKVGCHCHIGPNATISGRCEIGDLVFVGAGSSIKDYVNVCPNVTIGAGATVVKNIEEPGVYAGKPARRIK
jgi:UDP-N-acetylbacillosamine N-acetyltransferase